LCDSISGVEILAAPTCLELTQPHCAAQQEKHNFGKPSWKTSEEYIIKKSM
jgi:hypothetical protein